VSAHLVTGPFSKAQYLFELKDMENFFLNKIILFLFPQNLKAYKDMDSIGVMQAKDSKP